MITKKQFELNSLTHDTGRAPGLGSNGWAFLCDNGPDFCHVVSATGSIGSVVYLAAKSRLEIETMQGKEVLIKTKELKDLDGLREKIKSGSHAIKNNHIVPV